MKGKKQKINWLSKTFHVFPVTPDIMLLYLYEKYASLVTWEAKF